MKKIAIEYAHIYTNSQINEEHEISVSLLSRFTKGLRRQDYSLVVMIDDYSFPDSSFDYSELNNRLQKSGFSPDISIRESQLIPHCDEMLNNMTNAKLKKNIQDYIITKKKYPCSLFIATRYLIRLGSIHSNLYNKELIALETLSILPEGFKPFEDKAIEIIKKSIFAEQAKKIRVEYFEGRIVV